MAYDKGHISQLLKQLRWTPQLPIRQVTQRDGGEDYALARAGLAQSAEVGLKKA